MTKRERLYPEIKRLREVEGLLWREIGDRLGVSLKMAHEYYVDPTGEVARARKAKNNGICVDCSAETKNGGAKIAPKRCKKCADVASKSLPRRRTMSLATRGVSAWSTSQMIDAIRSVAVSGQVSVKAYLEAETTSGHTIPSYQTIHRRVGWMRALELAGVRAANGGGWSRSDRIPTQGLICAVQDCAAEIGRMPTYSEYQAYARRTGAPAAITVRNRFQHWQAAVDAALVDEVAA